MGYIYSVSFLSLHNETVQKLIRVATSGELISYESTDWDDIVKRQALVNNLLASISRNFSDYRDIRKQVRCWTMFKDDGLYQLFVGVPQHKLVGRTPGIRNLPWMEDYIPASRVSSIAYIHPGLIDSTEEMTLFVGRLLSQSENCRRAEAKVQDLSDEAVEGYFSELFKPHGWTPRREDDLLILERSSK